MRWWRAYGLDLPVSGISGNVIYARGRAAAVYRVSAQSFEFLSLAEKEQLHGRLSLWMIAAGADFSIHRVCREYPADHYVDDTVSLIDERFADRTGWETMLSRHAAHMREMRSFTPEFYFVISLQATSLIPFMARAGRDLKALFDAEQKVLETLTNYLPARRATTLELQWMLRRAGVRGVREPDIDPYWAPPALSLDGGVWEPGRADVQAFMPVVTEHRRFVRVECEDGESLQSMLVLGRPPRTADYPGSAELLFSPLESFDFPVDATVHARWISNKKMMGICDNAIKDAHDEVVDAAGRFLDIKTSERAQDVGNVQHYFRSEPYPPGLDTFISFAVGVPDGQEDVLKQRVSRLQRRYAVSLYRPYALQAKLFNEHLIKPDGAAPADYKRDYRRLLIVEQLAAMMPIGANEGGSRRGIYIGHTIPGVKRPIKYNPLEASELNRTGAILLNGTLGSGKTIAVQLLAYWAERRGSLVVDVDPKHPTPDHALDRLPDLAGRVDDISLADVDKHRGALDPLVVAPEAMREELASSFMMDVLPDVKHEWQTEIIDAVRAELRGANPCSWGVVDRLLADDDVNANAAGKALRTWADWGLCKLAFSRGGQGDLEATAPVTMIKASALTLPPAGTPHSGQSERVSVAMLKLIIARAMRMLAFDRTAHKMLVIDEAHIFGSSADGRRFLERVIRMGRYMNITVVLASQLLGDLAELGQLIGIRFVFRQETNEQASANLAMLGLDPTDERLISMLTTEFSDGRCLMRGLDGRVVAMRFDPVDPTILRLLDTNPTRIDIAELERQART